MLSLEETRRFLECDEFDGIDDTNDIFAEEENNDIEHEIDDGTSDINECLIQLGNVNGDYCNYIAEQIIAFNQYRKDALIYEDYEMASEALSDFKTKVSNAVKTVVAKFKEYVPKIVDWIKEKITSLIKYLGDKIDTFVAFIKKTKNPNYVKDDGNVEDIEEKMKNIEFIEVEGLDKDIMVWKKDVVQSSSFKTLWKTIKAKGINAVDAIVKALKNLPKVFEDLKNRILKAINKTENTVLKEDTDNESGTDIQKKSGMFSKVFNTIRSLFSRFTTFLSGMFEAARHFYKMGTSQNYRYTIGINRAFSSLDNYSFNLFKNTVDSVKKNEKELGTDDAGMSFIRGSIVRSIGNDPTRLKQFKKCLAYAKQNFKDDQIYENHDGEKFNTNKKDWTMSYMEEVMKAAQKNFSKERIDFLIRMVKYIYRDGDPQYKDVEED